MLAILATLAGMGAISASAVNGVTYYSCLKSGTLTNVSTKKTACPKGSTLVSFNSIGAQGQRGPQGEPGAQGPQGNQGIAGPAGPAGQDGAAGAQGQAGPRGLDAVTVFAVSEDGFTRLPLVDPDWEIFLLPNGAFTRLGVRDGEHYIGNSSWSLNLDSPGYRLFFKESDCSGIPVYGPPSLSGGFYVSPVALKFLQRRPYSAPASNPPALSQGTHTYLEKLTVGVTDLNAVWYVGSSTSFGVAASSANACLPKSSPHFQSALSAIQTSKYFFSVRPYTPPVMGDWFLE